MFRNEIYPPTSPESYADILVIYEDGIDIVTAAFALKKGEYIGPIENHIEYMLSRPTVAGTIREQMIREMDRRKSVISG